MDDIGWCPLPGCNSLANIEQSENIGKCQHCEFSFCLDCKEHVHPFKRCKINRVDLLEEFAGEMHGILENNKKMEDSLN